MTALADIPADDWPALHRQHVSWLRQEVWSAGWLASRQTLDDVVARIRDEYGADRGLDPGPPLPLVPGGPAGTLFGLPVDVDDTVLDGVFRPVDFWRAPSKGEVLAAEAIEGRVVSRRLALSDVVIAHLKSVRGVLAWAAGGWLCEDDREHLDGAREVIDEYLATGDPDVWCGCCSLCQEVACDDDCPLWLVRAELGQWLPPVQGDALAQAREALTGRGGEQR